MSEAGRVSGSLRGETHGEAPPATGGGLPGRAQLYLGIVAAATVAATLPFALRSDPEVRHWALFALLAVGAATTQLFVVITPRNQSYHTSVVFLVPAALLLSPELIALVAVIQHVPEWLKMRYAWYIQGFNMANYTLNGIAAWGVARLVLDSGVGTPGLRFAVAGAAACVVFVAVQHFVLATMLLLARGHTFRASGLFSLESLSTDLLLAALGVGIAALWEVNLWLMPLTVAPLLLIHRSLTVPVLEEQARIDPKTGLFNARHLAAALTDELTRARRFERPFSLLMADLDLLRDINNTYGHLAGDAVLTGIADVFRAELRHYDVPARFGGEEFSILLPETPHEHALAIAERIRRAVDERAFQVETCSEPIHATVSIGVATFPRDGDDGNELMHQADLAVYRAKLHGRNRVVAAGSDAPPPREEPAPAQESAIGAAEPAVPLRRRVDLTGAREQRHPLPHAVRGPRFLTASGRLALLVGLVSLVGVAAGVAAALLGASTDLIGLAAVLALVAGAQTLALELDDASISVTAAGALAAAALFGPRAALAVAVTTAAVEWSSRRSPLHQVLFNVGTLSLASLSAAGVFAAAASWKGPSPQLACAAAGLVAGAAYFAVNTGLLSLALAAEGHESWRRVWRERFAWLLPHYVMYGFVGAAVAIAYSAGGLYALAVFVVPLLLMRKAQAAYLTHTQESVQKLRSAAATIRAQNDSLEQANRLLRERSTKAMESLSATVDARDSYTAGHSRRVQQLALAIGRELGLSDGELEVLGHAALFHDVGKLAIPDAILLKPAALTGDEWAVMQRHSDEGAHIIDRLGFLEAAVPAIRHHHERWDGTGYPDRLSGEEIPLGARIIHVADALDSMLTTRIYRGARPALEAIAELRQAAGSQFCPRCVDALERALPAAAIPGLRSGRPLLRIAS